MQILLFDPFSGAAGDMILGALLDAGADLERVTAAMATVGEEPSIERVDRCGISALHVKTHARATSRTFDEVIERISGAGLPEGVRKMSERVFERMWRAESSVHGEQAHFHEVGADDAIADVIGACTALDSLGVEGVAVLPVRLGRGFIRGAHGTYPAPGPATLAILRDGRIPVTFSDTGHELCTPTGAAILSEFSSHDPDLIGASRIRSSGYGAGTRNPGSMPNVLRVSLLDSGTGTARDDIVAVLESNVDDVTGEVIACTIERLMEAGARDASAIPVVMKKGRPGYLVRVICLPADSRALAALLAAELGTLGVRCLSSVHRLVIPRTVETVPVRFGDRDYAVDVKVGWDGERPVSLKPEYEQVKAIARETGTTLRDASRRAEAAGWEMLAGRGA
jgi:uncharacterized protein (TIGR00299 family) protein